MIIFSSLKPFTSFKARCNKFTISSIVSAFSVNTLQRDNKAELISNDGFSVVAPIKIMLPCSTYGKKASC